MLLQPLDCTAPGSVFTSPWFFLWSSTSTKAHITLLQPNPEAAAALSAKPTNTLVKLAKPAFLFISNT